MSQAAKFLRPIAASSAPTPGQTDTVTEVVFIGADGDPEDLGGGGGSYTLPAATTSTLGGVKQAAAVADASGTVTAENFNGLLSALRTAGILATA